MHRQSVFRNVSRILAYQLAIYEPAHQVGKPFDPVGMEVGQVGAPHEHRMPGAEWLVAVDIDFYSAAPGHSIVAEQFEINLTMRAHAKEEQYTDHPGCRAESRPRLQRDAGALSCEALVADNLRSKERVSLGLRYRIIGV